MGEKRQKKCDNATKYSTFYSNSNSKTVINESDINDVFQSIYSMIISNIEKSLVKGSDWIINSAVNHTFDIPGFKP